MSWLNVRHSLLGLEDHPKEAGKCKSNHTWGRQACASIYARFGQCMCKNFTYIVKKKNVRIGPGNA